MFSEIIEKNETKQGEVRLAHLKTFFAEVSKVNPKERKTLRKDSQMM